MTTDEKYSILVGNHNNTFVEENELIYHVQNISLNNYDRLF